MITFDTVTKKYYGLTALDNLSLVIPRGEAVGILGPNGAGKTTLLKLIAGFMRPTNGRLTPSGNGWPDIGYKPERLLFPNHLRVGQYLQTEAGICNIPAAEAERAILENLARVNLLDSVNKKIRHMSKGMRQRLGLAQALMGNPALLLLDEPSNGLDLEGQVSINRLIKELRAAGKTIVISSHQLPDVTEVCTQLVILNEGQIHYQNSMADALSLQPYVYIRVDKPLAPIQDLLLSLHPDIAVDVDQLFLRDDAMKMRRQIFALLLYKEFDILHVTQKRTTLSEIYAGVVR
ncbi:MAG: ABC transporter ATP-binding protein [Methylococcales bacterium]|nr:ABC transporter ATP-binding protein [Methylococcales bacterium]